MSAVHLRLKLQRQSLHLFCAQNRGQHFINARYLLLLLLVASKHEGKRPTSVVETLSPCFPPNPTKNHFPVNNPHTGREPDGVGGWGPCSTRPL